MNRRKLRLRMIEHRRAILAVLHLAFFAVSFFMAFQLRFDFSMIPHYWRLMLDTIIIMIVVKTLVFGLSGLFSGWWRYVGTRDLVSLAKATTASTLIFAAIILVYFGRSGFPRSIFLLDWLLTSFLVGGFRLMLRLVREFYVPMRAKRPQTRALIVGAGDAGEGLLREVLRRPHMNYIVVGFLDDNPAKQGSVINDVQVLGPIESLPEQAERYDVGVALIAIPSATGEQMRRITELCEKAGVESKTLPGIDKIITGHVSLAMLREVDIEDLLRREAVAPDRTVAAELVQDRTVLVTGAGGSIGAELCRQIARLGPREIVMIERSENALFEVDRELRESFPSQAVSGHVADIRSGQEMRRLMSQHSPSLVFHAAAHKHVPLMERSPAEAIRNNVLGTMEMADLSAEAGVERFVSISTDKAVDPSSVMGATKRMAEFYVLGTGAEHPKTEFLAVRFGNVLGSSGSVVPIFRKQIQLGGPVTVTHREMKRFFMTIPEAVELVLQAAKIGVGGTIMALDMGEQVKVVDLAEDLIRLSGLTPGEDIEIVFTGIRPGEKLSEEIASESERLEKTEHPKIFAVEAELPQRETVLEAIAELRKLTEHRMEATEARARLFEVLERLESRAGG